MSYYDKLKDEMPRIQGKIDELKKEEAKQEAEKEDEEDEEDTLSEVSENDREFRCLESDNEGCEIIKNFLDKHHIEYHIDEEEIWARNYKFYELTYKFKITDSLYDLLRYRYRYR